MIRDFELDAIIGERHPEFPNGDIATLNENLETSIRFVYFTFSQCFFHHDHNGETSSCRRVGPFRAHLANNRGSLSQWIRSQVSQESIPIRTMLSEKRDQPRIRRYTHHRMLPCLRTVRQQRLQCLVLLRLHANGLVLPPTFDGFDSQTQQVTQYS